MKQHYYRASLVSGAALLLGLLPFQGHALSLKLESSAGSIIEISDNQPGDADATIGAVLYSGPIDDITAVVGAGFSKPLVGSVDQAQLNLSVVSTSGATSRTLRVTVTDNGFGSAFAGGDTTLTGSVGGSNSSGQTSFQGFADNGNAEFGSADCATAASGPHSGIFENLQSTPCSVTGEFALTLTATSSQAPFTVQSYGADLLMPIPDEPIGCRFTGGGVDTDGNWNHELESGETIRNGAGNLPPGIDRYQFGGQVGARTAQQPQPSGEWQHHQQTGPSGDFAFHGGTSSAAPGTRIVDVRCSDPGFCFPARPAPAKQLDFDGIGTFSNVGKGKSAPKFDVAAANVIPEPNGKKDNPFTFHWFEVNIDDLGEPGRLNSGAPGAADCPGRGFGEKSAGVYIPDPVNDPATTVILPPTELAECDCPDFYRIAIYRGVLSTEVSYLPDGRVDPASLDRSTVIYEAFGYIDGGNLQIHPPTGFDRK